MKFGLRPEVPPLSSTGSPTSVYSWPDTSNLGISLGREVILHDNYFDIRFTGAFT
jgi:hypothetical protein